MLHDDSFITGLLIGDKRGYRRGLEDGGGGTGSSRDTIEFGDGMTADIWTVPTFSKAECLDDGRCADEWEKQCLQSSLRADYCCAILTGQYGLEAWANWTDPTVPPDYTGQLTFGTTYVSLHADGDRLAVCSHPIQTKGCKTWEADMWFVVSPSLICCIAKPRNYSIPCVVWGFVYGQGQDGGEWRPWTGPGLTATSDLGWNGTAGDLSNPDSTVGNDVGAAQLRVNLESGKPAQVDNVWYVRNTTAIARDTGSVTVIPNFKSVGTATKHDPDGRRLMYLAHDVTLPSGTYPAIYNMYFVLLPRGTSKPSWRGLLDDATLDDVRGNSITMQWDREYAAMDNIPGSYFSGYNKGYEDGLAAGGNGGGEPDGSYDEGYREGYRDGYAAGLAAAGGDDGYTLHPAPDGATELYVTIEAASLRAMQLCFCQTVARGVQIDWGDGSALETMAGTGAVYPAHDYNSNGDYVIRLLPADDCGLALGGGNSVARTVTNDNTAIAAGRICVVRKAVIGKNVTTVGRYAFTNALTLEEVYVSDGVETLGAYCFMGDIALHRVRLPSTLKSISDGAEFSGCAALSEIDIPASVTTIGTNTFATCQSLRRISFPGIVSIANAALNTCRGLQRVDFPATMQSLAYNFAAQTINLREIHLAATVPPALNGTLATGYSNFVVYIPAGSLAAYSTADRWNSIASKLIEE